MRKLTTLALAVTLVILSVADVASARGRGGGGGGRRPSPSAGRSRSLPKPSASRSRTKPSLPKSSMSTKMRSASNRSSRPQKMGSRNSAAAGLKSKGLDRAAASLRGNVSKLHNSLPGAANQLRSAKGAGNFFDNRANAAKLNDMLKSHRDATKARDRLADSQPRSRGEQRRSDVQGRRSDLASNLADRQPLQDRADDVRSRMENQLQRLENIPFTPAWYDNHPLADRLCSDLAPAAWSALAAWVGAAAQPVAYEPAAYEETQAYTAETTSYEEPAPVTEEVSVEAVDAEWLALGVYALAMPGQTESAMLLQLFVNTEGTINGTYLHVPTDNTQPVNGHVNAASQQVTFKIQSNSRLTFECGLHNLTQDETLVTVRANNGTTQLWTMVRLPQSDS